MAPLVVGALAVGLLRHWRLKDHQTMVSWFDLIAQAMELDQSEHAARFTAHRLEAADGYEAWSSTYDGGNPLIAREHAFLLQLLEPVEARRALDAACGTGRVSELLSSLGYSVLGVDQSEGMLERAREKGIPKAEFRSGEVNALPVDRDHFDLVSCCLALTHVEDLALAIGSLAGAMKPSGRLIISHVHPYNSMLGAHANFTMESGDVGIIPNFPHAMSAYLKAFSEADLVVNDCHELELREADVDATFAEFGRRLGTDYMDAMKEALVGVPMVLIWDLRRSGAANR